MKKLTFILVALFAFSFSSEAQIRVITNGNTGIGTTTPAEQLHVDGNALIESNGYTGHFIRSATSASQIRFRSGSISSFAFDDLSGTPKATATYDHGLNALSFQNLNGGQVTFFSNNKIMYWAPTGRLGVGTNAPSRNLHVVGNAGKTDGTSTWDILSDRRLKKNINKYSDGLEAILQINPVTFEYTGEYGTVAERSIVGVIAQDVEEVAPYMVSTLSLSETDTKKESAMYDSEGKEIKNEMYTSTKSNTQDFLSLNNDAFTYMLINAVKEQQTMIEAQNEKLAELEELIKTATNNGIGSINQSEVNLTYSDVAELKQNIPNPFNGSTTIQYTIPKNATSSTMIITDMAGKVLKNISLNHIGEGQLTINATDIPSGTYNYQLSVDGRVISTKKMVLHQ